MKKIIYKFIILYDKYILLGKNELNKFNKLDMLIIFYYL